MIYARKPAEIVKMPVPERSRIIFILAVPNILHGK